MGAPGDFAENTENKQPDIQGQYIVSGNRALQILLLILLIVSRAAAPKEQCLVECRVGHIAD